MNFKRTLMPITRGLYFLSLGLSLFAAAEPSAKMNGPIILGA